MNRWSRAILHVDMDAFYASVEQRDNPQLRGKAVLVGGVGGRGVVSAASYEARKFGCHSAQPMAVARRMCPAAIVVGGDMRKYARISDQMIGILNDFSPLIEPISIDEAFVDVTGSVRLLGDPQSIARDIKTRIHRELQLTASIGVAANKFLAKLASDLQKPDGLTVIAPDEVVTKLPPLPVGRIWGVGPKTANRLANLGIRTIGDLLRMPLEELNERFGESGEHYWRLARGLDERDVVGDHDAKSIGHETTFFVNLIDPEEVRAVLLELTEQVAARLRRHNRQALSIGLKIRFGDFKTITRAHSLAAPTDLTVDLWTAARAVFDDWAATSFSPVRLIGVSVSHLTDSSPQLSLFDHPTEQRQRKLDAAVDAINARFGKRTVGRGGRPRRDEE